MRVGVLGPVEVSTDRTSMSPESSKERALLAVLAVRAGRPVPVDTLIDALWGDDAPATAERTLASHVSRLRAKLGPERIIGDATGYRFAIAPGDVDAHRLTELVDACAGALAARDFGLASRLAGLALDLWRGEPLTDLADGRVRAGERARLDELRLVATEQRVVAELGLGHHERLIGELEALVAEHPLHEALWEHLMVALYRAGRQGEALRAYQRLRHLLASELGIEPMARVARVEQMILLHDAQLDLDPPPPPGNLPVAPDSFVGRIADTRQVRKCLGEHRLVTLVGPGGVGKSRLALEVAASSAFDHPDGTWWVDLAPVHDVEAIDPLVAEAMGVKAAPGTTARDAVARYVRHRQLLLVVDNCEHLTQPVAHMIERTLRAGPQVTVLATSRTPVGAAGEHRLVVTPLSTPDGSTGRSDPLESDAVRLFVERLGDVDTAHVDTAADADLAAIGELCHRLDGMPLAIELVASRASYLTPHELLERLPETMVATRRRGNHDPRYDSMQAAIEWSHDLLEPAEQLLLARLSVAPAAFDLGFVEAVGAPLGAPAEVTDHFGRLVEASLVQVVPADGHGRRFRLLQTIRDFGQDRLDDATRHDARRRHADHFRALAQSVGVAIESQTEPLITTEYPNLRAAADWSLEHDDPALSIELGPAIGRGWFLWGDPRACIAFLDRLLEGAATAAPLARAWTIYWSCWPALLHNDVARAWSALDAAFALGEDVGDPRLLAAIHTARGHVFLLGAGDVAAAVPHYERAIAEPTGPSAQRHSAQLSLAQALALGDRTSGLDDLLDRVGTELEAAENDDDLLAQLSMDRALVAWSAGDVEAIVPLAEAGVRHARAARNPSWEQINLTSLGIGHLEIGRPADAEVTLLGAARLALDTGNLLQLGIALQALAAVAARRGRSPTAASLLGAGTRLAPFWPLFRRQLGPHLQPARDALGDDFDRITETGRALTPPEAVALAIDDASA